MTKRLISFLIALCLLIAIPLSARYKYNPFTRKLDYYEPVSGSDLGDLGDVTLTGLATGNVLYYNGTAWVNLATGANTNVLTLAGGVPTWAAPGAPAAHAASHEVGGADLVDHDQLTNYLAAQHLTLPNTLVAVLTDHNLAAHTALGIPNPANVFYISATGGDYTTIQAALNAQNSGGETFLVAPGTYTDTISFTASDQVVKPLGHAANVIVTQADANIVDGGIYTDCIIEGIEIRLTAPTTAINAIQVGTGTLILIECRGYLATAVALAQADQPSLIGFTEAGTIRIKRGNYQYYHTGNTGGSGIKAAFRANFNLAELHLHKADVIIVTNSGTAAVTSLFVTSGTAVTEMHNCIDCVVTDPNATLVVGLGYVGGGGAHNVQGNHVDVIATNNTSYGLYHNGTATVRSGFNAIHASDAAGTSYAFYVGASATLNSHFDDLRSNDGNNVAGTLVAVNSETDGDLTITTPVNIYNLSHDSFADWVGNKHIDWTNATQNLSTEGSATLNDDGTTGETGLNLYSISSTFSTIAQSDAEGIATKSDLRIGLDEGLRALYLMDRGDIGTDFDSTAYVHPSLVFVNKDTDDYGYIAMEDELWAFINITGTSFWFETPHYFDFIVDGAGGDLTTGIVFRIGTLEDGTGEFVKNTGTQVFFEIEPWVNQTGTAAYQALKANVTETGTGSGTNELLTLQVGSTDVFTVGNKGSLDLTMSHLASRVVIAQSSATGTEDQPLIFIDDDRTGDTANEVGEATIVMDAAGVYALYIQNGVAQFATAQFSAGTSINEFSIDGTLGGNSDDAVPTEKAVKTYVDTNYQPLDDALTDISGLVYVSDSFIKFVANDDYSVRTLTETAEDLEADIETVIDTLANLTSIQGQTVTFSGSLNVEANSNINQDVTSDGSPTFGGLTVTNLLSFPATRNIVLGDATPAGFGTAIANVFIGLDAGTSTTEGDYNISIGEEAGNFNQTGIGSVKIGYQAGKGGSAKSDGYNVIIGHKTAGFGALEGNGFNVVMGNEAGFQLTTGSQNFLLGYQAGYDLTTQGYNAFLGGVSGKDCIGTGNTGIGYGTMAGGIGAWAGNYNVAIGYNAMAHIAAASGNIGIGFQAGQYMETGANNVIVGYQAGMGVDGEPFDYNILIGTDVGKLITTASSNVMIGYHSGDAVTSGGDHVLVGEKTGSSLTTQTGNVMIGHDVGELATVSNELWIDNSNTATPLIHGDFSTTILTINGNFHVTGEIESGDYVVSQEVNFDDGSPVEICSVADGYVVTDVYVEVTTIWDGNGTITIGDGDDTDGFIRDADIDQTTAAYYGWHLDERGDYLWDGPDHGDHKIYMGADTVDATLVQGTSAQGVATVYVHITRLK